MNSSQVMSILLTLIWVVNLVSKSVGIGNRNGTNYCHQLCVPPFLCVDSPSVFNYLPPPKPPKKRQCEDPSSFLSTRKRRKVEASQDPKEEDASQVLKEDDASLTTNTLGCRYDHVTLMDDDASLSHIQHTQKTCH